jgi:hypothetical protein
VQSAEVSTQAKALEELKPISAMTAALAMSLGENLINPSNAKEEATVDPTVDVEALPRAFVVSATATHVPSDSLQTFL